MYTADKEWEKFGKDNPYYGVIVDEKYKTKNLNNEIKNVFFTSGESYVKNVFSIIESLIGGKFKPQMALDFGCGTGRLTIPLAKRSNKIMGIDISESILKEAAKNAEDFGLNNIDFKPFSDTLISSNKFDFINTYIVLQHITVSRGIEIIKSMLSSLEENGIAVIHVTFYEDNYNRMKLRNIFNPIIGKSSIAASFYRIFKNFGKKADFSEPFMQMNFYDLNAINKLLYDFNCILIHNEFTNHGGPIGSLMFIQKINQKQHTF
ncbi:MAG: methylase involved in ubiquinone/menaquinone biosynthesis [Mucilaginibacter sp.]|nr:methylase involved in ubiquinone/menaquinone biosynthesis [Mucilaginibacter sp.]